MKLEDLLTELKSLDLPTNKFATTSSGPMGIRKIREINDLDIIVYPDLWLELKNKYPVTKENNFESIYIGNIQVLGDNSWFSLDTINDINSADIINGFRWVKLEKILKIKKQQTRPKDIADVQLIEEYLQKNSN